MLTKAQWKNKTFAITDEQMRPLEGISRDYKIKKKSVTGRKTPFVEGHENESFSLSYSVGSLIGTNPLDEYLSWCALLGGYAPLLLGDTLFGPPNIMLKNVTLDSENIRHDGSIADGEISLEFIEYEKEGKNESVKAAKYASPLKNSAQNTVKQAATGLFKLLYNSKDISEFIDLKSCIHDMFADNRSDSLVVKFLDTKRLWDGWKPAKEEIIEVTDGIARTGRMFIEDVKPENGIMNLKAVSIPPSMKNIHSKSWDDITISELFKEKAQDNGLDFEPHNVPQITYPYLKQEKQTDLAFLQERAELEGLAFLIFDKKLVLYDEAVLEKSEPKETINIQENNDFTYSDNSSNAYGRMLLTNGAYTGVYESKNGIAKEASQVIETFISGQSEADRFAKNMLRKLNKELTSGNFKIPQLKSYAPGSVFNLNTPGASSWNGAAFICRMRQDYVSKESKIFIRKAIV